MPEGTHAWRCCLRTSPTLPRQMRALTGGAGRVMCRAAVWVPTENRFLGELNGHHFRGFAYRALVWELRAKMRQTTPNITMETKV